MQSPDPLRASLLLLCVRYFRMRQKLDVQKIIAEGNDAAVFFELETNAQAEATTLVAEWHQVKNGKISRVESAFDGRPFAAMFASGKRT
jgi:hypothetical protein